MFSHHIPPKKKCFFHEWCFTLKQEIHQHLSIYPIISSIFLSVSQKSKKKKRLSSISKCFTKKKKKRLSSIFECFTKIQKNGPSEKPSENAFWGQPSRGGPKFRWLRCAFWTPDGGTELGQSLGGTSPGSSTVERCGVISERGTPYGDSWEMGMSENRVYSQWNSNFS